VLRSLYDQHNMSSEGREAATAEGHDNALLALHATLPYVLQCLRLADVQRLACTCQRFRRENESDPHWKRTKAWLEEMEILYDLRCPSWLRRKMSRSILLGTYRVIAHCPAAGPPTKERGIFGTLTEAFVGSNVLTTEGGCEELSFERAHEYELENVGLEPGEHYFDVEKRGSEDDDDDIHPRRNCRDGAVEGSSSSPRRKRARTAVAAVEEAGCDFQFCGRPAGTSLRRLYFAGASRYCGACLDGSLGLRLRYCREHGVGEDYRHNTDWTVAELPYDDNEESQKEAKEGSGLRDEEFWVRVWRTDPLNEFELRFVGVGPRG